jgi:threonine dehydrogenase-like Zn-dependent dehydrogenase
MRAVVFKDIGQILVEERPKPELIHPGDVIIKVKVAALCGSDLHWYRGTQKIPTGFIPGHEFVGIVDVAGKEVTNVQVGDLVVVCPGLSKLVVVQWF